MTATEERPELSDYKNEIHHPNGSIEDIWDHNKYVEDLEKYCDILESKAENLPKSDVRLSCFKEVWQKWCEAKTAQEFDKWVHDKMHEA